MNAPKLATTTYTQCRNANGDWVKDDVEECEESGDPEREDQQDDQPNDEPKCFCHFDLRNKLKIKSHETVEKDNKNAQNLT